MGGKESQAPFLQHISVIPVSPEKDWTLLLLYMYTAHTLSVIFFLATAFYNLSESYKERNLNTHTFTHK